MVRAIELFGPGSTLTERHFGGSRRMERLSFAVIYSVERVQRDGYELHPERPRGRHQPPPARL